MDLVDQLLRVTYAFGGAQLPYALCGGLAVAVHGAPRATTDLDLLIREEDLDRALGIARDLGFTFKALPMRFADGMRIQRVTQIEGRESLILDLILVTESLEPVFRGREEFVLRGASLWVVSRDGLIAMKAWSARPQDLADIERLTELDR